MSSFTIKTNPSVKELKIWLLKISFGVVFVVFGIFGVFSDVFGALPFEEDFDDYILNSELDGQGGWITLNNPVWIKDTEAVSSPHSANVAISATIARRLVDDLAEGVFSGSVWLENSEKESRFNIVVRHNENSAYGCIATLDPHENKAYSDQWSYGDEILTGLDLQDKWSNFDFSFRASDDRGKLCVNDACSEWFVCSYGGTPTYFDTIDGIQFRAESGAFFSGSGYFDDLYYGEEVCALDNCGACDEYFECQYVGCCWYYQPWWPPPFDNFCGECEGTCSYETCGLCSTEEDCEAVNCYWFGEYCSFWAQECGGELACQFCLDQETCEAEDCNWNELSETCWYAVPTLPSSWSTYYDTHGGYETPAEFVNELAQTTGETLAVVSGLFEGFMTSFNTADALARGTALGNVIPKGRGYLKVFDGLFGHYPIGETFVFILIFMLAVGLFRIVRQLIALIKP